jgi:hypothetical protein
VRVFELRYIFEDAIGSHACSLQASMRVVNGIPLGCSLRLPVHTVHCNQTRKAMEDHGTASAVPVSDAEGECTRGYAARPTKQLRRVFFKGFRGEAFDNEFDRRAAVHAVEDKFKNIQSQFSSTIATLDVISYGACVGW